MAHEHQCLSTILGFGMYAFAQAEKCYRGCDQYRGNKKPGTAALKPAEDGGSGNFHESLILMCSSEVRSVKCFPDWVSYPVQLPF